MNVYDPIEEVIRGESFDLDSLKCNAVYEVTLSFADLTSDCLLTVNAATFTPQGITDKDVLLSNCVDFDVFLESDLEETDDTWEKIYNRITTLSSSLDSHPHFYVDEEEEEKQARISLLTDTQAITPVRSNSEEFKVYINVNYSPNEMKQYASRIQSFNENIRALFDFAITIQVDKVTA